MREITRLGVSSCVREISRDLALGAARARKHETWPHVPHGLDREQPFSLVVQKQKHRSFLFQASTPPTPPTHPLPQSLCRTPTHTRLHTHSSPTQGSSLRNWNISAGRSLF